MDQITKQTADGFIGAFDPYIEGNPKAQEIVSKFADEVYALAENCKNVTDFMSRFQKEGLQDKYTNLFSTLYMQSEQMKAAGNNETTQEEDNARLEAAASGESEYVPIAERLTVRQFVEQYRTAYDEIKKGGNRKNAEAAYEELFAVADRTDDLQEMSLILEREHLLFKIASVDLAESGTMAYRSMDPHWDLTRKGMAIRAAAYTDSRSDEELTYKTEITKRTAERADFNEQFRYAAIFGGIFSTTVWWVMELAEVRAGGGHADACIRSLIRQRKKARELWPVVEGMGISWDDIVSDPYLRILVQYPTQCDELFRTKMVLPPEQVEAVRYIWENEIMSSRSLEDILIDPSPLMYYLRITSTKGRVESAYMEKAKALNWELPFFEFSRNVNGQGGVQMPGLGSTSASAPSGLGGSAGAGGGASKGFGGPGGAGKGLGGIAKSLGAGAGAAAGSMLKGAAGSAVREAVPGADKVARGVGKLKGLFGRKK